MGLNFRDLLNVLGMYPGDPGLPGGDCAGIITALGAGEYSPSLSWKSKLSSSLRTSSARDGACSATSEHIVNHDAIEIFK